MHILRRSALGFIQTKRLRQSWKNLCAFTVTENDVNAWNLIRQNDNKVENFIEKFSNSTTKQKTAEEIKKENEKISIDWSSWESKIAHRDILECMKAFYTNQISILDDVARVDSESKLKEETIGWKNYDECLKSCRESVERCDKLVKNGGRALWISYNNPSVHLIDPNEWLDSDSYWAAYVEKHNASNPNQSTEDPESSQEIQESKNSWHARVSKFNDRSDTPILFQYMEQLPSWEFYDINRRKFLEHMLYYLIRTGNDFRFFPEIPPVEWKTHIEKLRFRFLSVAHRRRAHFQYEELQRERSFDFHPADLIHEGEEFYLKLLQNETKKTEMFVARLMGNFMFLCAPFIPIQNACGILHAMSVDNGQGALYTLGEDVNALFYLPIESKRFIHTPQCAFNALMDYLNLTGRRLNPVYASLLEIHAILVSMRGKHWLKCPEENVREAFLRRIRSDDPAKHIYEQYVKELEERLEHRKQLLSESEILEKLEKIEKLYNYECTLYKYLLYSEANLDISVEGKAEKDKLGRLHDLNELNDLIVRRNIQVFDEISEPADSHSLLPHDTQKCKHAEVPTNSATGALISSFNDFDIEKDVFADLVRSIKMTSLEK